MEPLVAQLTAACHGPERIPACGLAWAATSEREKDRKAARLEDWKIGRLEDWKIGDYGRRHCRLSYCLLLLILIPSSYPRLAYPRPILTHPSSPSPLPTLPMPYRPRRRPCRADANCLIVLPAATPRSHPHMAAVLGKDASPHAAAPTEPRGRSQLIGCCPSHIRCHAACHTCTPPTGGSTRVLLQRRRS
jgi:hypothetical protein